MAAVAAGDQFEQFKEDITERIVMLESYADGSDLSLPASTLVHELTEYLAAIRDADMAGFTIGFAGETGAGKSSLINRIIGQDGGTAAITKLLASRFGCPCTGTLVEIIPWDTDRLDFFAAVTFTERSEFDEFVSTGQTAKGGQDSDDLDPDAVDTVRAVVQGLTGLRFPDQLPGDWADAKPDTLLTVAARAFIEKGFLNVQADDADTLRKKLNQFATKSDNAASYWPIVERISIRGPFPRLRGCTLIDIPGTGDGNVIMERRHASGLACCDRVYFVIPSCSALQHLGHYAKMKRICETPSVSFQSGVVVTHARQADQARDDDDGPYTVAPTGLVDARQFYAKAMQDDLVKTSESNGDGAADWFRHLPIYFVDLEDTGEVLESTFVNGFYKDAMTTPLDHVNELACGRVQDQLEVHVEVMCYSQPNYAEPLELLQAAMSASASAFEATVTKALRLNLSVIDVCRPDILKWTSSTSPFATVRWQRLHKLLEHPDPDFAKSFVDAIRLPGQEAVLSEYTRHRESLLEIAKRQFEDQLEKVPTAGCSRVEFVALIRRVGLAKIDCLVPMSRADFMRRLDGSACRRFLEQFAKTLAKQSVSGIDCQCTMRNKLVSFFNRSRDDMKAAVFDATVTEHKQIIERETEIITSTLRSLLQSVQCKASTRELKSICGIVVSMTAPRTTASIPGGGPAVDDSAGMLSKLHVEFAPNDFPLCALPPTYTGPRRPDSGSVYVFSNAAFRRGVYKIGFTSQPIGRRAEQLRTTGVPLRFEIEEQWREVKNMRFMEKLMHLLFADYRLSTRREFFEVPLPVIKHVGNAVKEFVNARIDRLNFT